MHKFFNDVAENQRVHVLGKIKNVCNQNAKYMMKCCILCRMYTQIVFFLFNEIFFTTT